LTSERKRIIQNYLEQKRLCGSNPFDEAGYAFPRVDEFGFCVFYSTTTKECKIHVVKPESCRAGPVTFDINFETGKIEWFLKKGEICAFAERLYQNQRQFREHLDLAKEELLQLVRQLNPESLRIILRIDEPCTFKIGEDELPTGIIEMVRSGKPFSMLSKDACIS
jgi:Fe-S-cluster containining protein